MKKCYFCGSEVNHLNKYDKKSDPPFNIEYSEDERYNYYCDVCWKSVGANADKYPFQYDVGTIRMIAICTNMILKALEEK